jgi:hypothetical protein
MNPSITHQLALARRDELLRQAADWRRAHHPVADPALGADRELRIRLASQQGARQGRGEERPQRPTAPASVVLINGTPRSQRRRNETHHPEPSP